MLIFTVVWLLRNAKKDKRCRVILFRHKYCQIKCGTNRNCNTFSLKLAKMLSVIARQEGYLGKTQGIKDRMCYCLDTSVVHRHQTSWEHDLLALSALIGLCWTVC